MFEILKVKTQRMTRRLVMSEGFSAKIIGEPHVENAAAGYVL
jgi:hypothetical protein